MLTEENYRTGKYWQKSWGLVDGCTPCSPGCDHCWSAAIKQRFSVDGTDLLKVTRGNEWEFSGKVTFREDRLDIPIRTRKPTVFSAWNDLFHERVKARQIAEAWDTMTRCPKHKFLVLTKRVEHLFSWASSWKLLPFSNIYVGTTVCNQAESNEKIPELLKVPGHKWLSIEPLLSEVNISSALPHRWVCSGSRYRTNGPIGNCKGYCQDKTGKSCDAVPCPKCGKFHYWCGSMASIDWVVAGPETGPRRRPCNIEWIRSVVQQCKAAGVPVWVKAVDLGKRVSHKMTEWPEDLRVREVPWQVQP